MRKLNLILICLVTFIFAQIIFAGNTVVDRKLEKAIEKLVKDYKSKKEVIFKKTVAVMDFEDISTNAQKYNIGKSISDMFTSKLSEVVLFRVVERKKIASAMKELELGLTGLTEKDTAEKIGKFLNADMLITGSVSELGENFNINIRIIEVETAEVLSAQTINIPREDLIAEQKTLMLEYVAKGGIGVGFNLGIWLFGYNPNISDFMNSFSGGSGPIGTGTLLLNFEFKYRIQTYLLLSVGVNVGLGEEYYHFEGYDAQGKYTYYVEHITFMLAVPIKCYYVYTITKKLNIFAGTGVNGLTLVMMNNKWERFNDETREIEYPTVKAKYDAGDGALLALEIGAEYFLSPRVAVNLKAGYNYSFGYKFKVRYWDSEEDRWASLDTNDPAFFRPNGDSVEIDFSGFYSTLGFSLYF